MSTNLPKLRAGKFGVISIDTPDLAQARIFCDVLWMPGDIRQAERYAKEVVKRVNGYPAVLSAARDLFAALQALTPPADLGEVDLDDEERQHLDHARAVLAKWEGKL